MEFFLAFPQAQQPSGPVAGKTGLTAAGYGSIWPADLGLAVVSGVSGTKNVGPAGMGILNPRAKLTVPALGSTFTLIVIAKDGVAANSENWLGSDDAGSNRIFQFRLSASSQVELIRFPFANIVTAAIPDTAKTYVAVATCSGNDLAVYGGNIGGAVSKNTGAITGTPAAHTAAIGIYVGSRDATLANPFTGTMFGYVVLPVCIPEQLARSIISNPWQLLPRDSMALPFETAAGIAFDAAGNSGDQAATNTYSGSASWSGSDRLLAVDVSMLGAGVTVSSMTYGGAACTFVGAISTVTSFGRVEQWRIVQGDSGAPAAGSNTLVVNLSGSLEFVAEWASYTGVHQTSPTEAFASAQATNAGSATDASVAVTSIADNCWIHAAVVANDTSITAGNTSRNNVSGTLGSGANEDNGAPKTPAGSVTMSYSGMGITTTWGIAGYAIRPVAASGLAGNFFSFNPPLRGGLRHLGGGFQGG